MIAQIGRIFTRYPVGRGFCVPAILAKKGEAQFT